MTGFGIVGAGVAARYHARAIAATPGARLAAVCRSDPARGNAAADELGAPCEPSYEALLARKDVDAVCICTPSGLHPSQAVAAARAGKHVLVEKPMALTLGDADAMIQACRAAAVRLGVAYQRRTEPSFQAIHSAMTAGDLGRPLLGLVTVPYFRGPAYFGSASWRATWELDGGGVLMNQGIHLVDLLLWFLGEVEEVHARTATLSHSIEVEDTAAATLRFKSGALGTIIATTAASPGFPHRVEVYGSRGGVQAEGDGAVLRWEGEAAGGHPVASSQATVAAGGGASATGIALTGHARIVGDFVTALREGREPLVPGEEGRRSLALVLALYQSARTGLPVRPEH